MRAHEGPSPKSLDWNNNFKLGHTLCCRNIKICCAHFWRLWAKKCSIGTKIVFLEQEVQYYMVHIAYYSYTELNLQICNYAQKRRICRENSTHAKLKTTFAAIFALVERLPTLPPCVVLYVIWPRRGCRRLSLNLEYPWGWLALQLEMVYNVTTLSGL